MNMVLIVRIDDICCCHRLFYSVSDLFIFFILFRISYIAQENNHKGYLRLAAIRNTEVYFFKLSRHFFVAQNVAYPDLS